MASRQRNKLLAPTKENWIVRNQQCISPFLDDSLEGRNRGSVSGRTRHVRCGSLASFRLHRQYGSFTP